MTFVDDEEEIFEPKGRFQDSDQRRKKIVQAAQPAELSEGERRARMIRFSETACRRAEELAPCIETLGDATTSKAYAALLKRLTKLAKDGA